jgi:hypothetical protein
LNETHYLGSDVELHSNNMEREEGFSQSKSWKPLVQTLKEWKKTLSEEK